MTGLITDKFWKGIYQDAGNKAEATENGAGEGAHHWGAHTKPESLSISVCKVL